MADVLPLIRGTFSDSGSNENATLVTGSDTAVGDLIIAWHAIDWETGSIMGPPTGTAGTWTELHSPTLSDLGTNFPHLKAWYRRATVAGAQRVTVTGTANSDAVLIVCVVDGTTVAPGAAAIDAATGTKSATASTAHTVPSLAMTGARDRLLVAVASGLNSTTATPIDYTAVAPMSKLREIDSAAWITLAVGTITFTSAGTTGTRTFTSSVSRYWVGAVVALRGAVAANPKTIDLAPLRVVATTQAGVDYVKTGQTRDLGAVRAKATAQRVDTPRDVDAAPVADRHTWQRPVVERGIDLYGAPLKVRFSFPEITITNTTLTPVRVRVGAIQVPDNIEVVSVTPLTDRTKRPTSQTYVRPRKNLRFLAQEALSRRWVSWDLGLREPEVTWNVNAANEITGKIDAREVAELGLDQWAHFIHLEQNGQIRNSGLLLPWSVGGPEVTLTAAGVTRYPQGLPYQGNFNLGNPVGQQIDPLDVVRHCWAHLQGYRNGRLGVLIAPTTSPVRIGEPERDVNFTAGAGTAAEEDVSFTTGPYLLKWWENTDIGKEIDDLAKETPFDYREAPRWNDARDDVVQYVELGYPRLGRDQSSLSFAQGQNLIEALAPVADDEHYAGEVIVLGKGEGTARVRGSVAVVDGIRVRRAVVVEVKNADTTSRAQALARDERASRTGLLEVDEVHLLGNHPNAPFGSFAAGDDIPVRMTVEGHGDLVIRHRVTGFTLRPEVADLTVRTKRSDSFSYAAAEVAG